MSRETLAERLNYLGGVVAENRFQMDKLRSLKKALLYSYQAATAVLSDGREFRCLINDDKLSTDYTDKIISIPYKDICLNTDRLGKTWQGEEEIGMKPGDVFQWKETGTYWLVYLEYLEEDAYFRAEIRECEAETEIYGHHYWLYLRGPTETTIQWNQKNNIVWNDINYSLIGYLTKTDEVLDYFHRFKTIKIDEKQWEVKTVNPYFGKGIVKICLGEWFNNEMEEVRIKPGLPDEPNEDEIYIEGQLRVHPYDILTYTIHNVEDGNWSIDNNHKAKLLDTTTSEEASVEILTGKSGQFTLSYIKDNEVVYEIEIVIESL